MDFLKVYTAYVQNFNTSMAVVERVQKKKEVAAYFQVSPFVQWHNMMVLTFLTTNAEMQGESWRQVVGSGFIFNYACAEDSQVSLSANSFKLVVG